jgi:hypothetical protein
VGNGARIHAPIFRVRGCGFFFGSEKQQLKTGWWEKALAATFTAAPLVANAVDHTGWTPIADVRLRYEEVGQVPLALGAAALTLRARLGVSTPELLSTSLLVEGDFLAPLDGQYRPDSAVLYHSQYPVVADPRAHQLNRLALRNHSLPQTTITVGRQRIELDDQRFVGSAGWRQNEQTYDGVRVVNQSIHNLTLDVAYLDRVNRVYTEDSPQGVYRGDMFLGNASYKTPLGKLTAFTYLLSFDAIAHFANLTPAAAAALNPANASTSTWGLRFAGSRSLGAVKLSYTVSWATQERRGDNPYVFHNDYVLGELAAGWHWLELRAGDEVMQGNGTLGFATPLATTHQFDGWADKFLTTPARGLDNRYVALSATLPALGPVRNLTLKAVHRSFTAELDGTDYGLEWDFQLVGKWGRFTPQLAFADYQAGASTPLTVARDTHKLFVQIDYSL